jgi:hypothetical protein
MTEKVLVEVYLPMANQTFEAFLPKMITIEEVVTLLSRMLEELASVFYSKTENEVLCDRESGEIYDMSKTVEQLRIMNGSKLMLI